MIEKKDRVALGSLHLWGLWGSAAKEKHGKDIQFLQFLGTGYRKKNKVSYTSYSLHTFVTVTGV